MACETCDLGGQLVDAVERGSVLLVELADAVLEGIELVGDPLDPLALLIDLVGAHRRDAGATDEQAGSSTLPGRREDEGHSA